MSNRAGMTEAGRTRFFEFLGAGVLALVSVLARGVSAYSTYWQRQQVRATVLPRLQLATGTEEGLMRLVLENVGVGPADLKTVQVALDGKPVLS